MRTFRVCALVAFAILSGLGVARAADLTGIYVVTYGGGLEYFNLTQQSGYLTGYLQTVAVNTNSSDGVNRQSYSVSGSVSGSRAVLRLSSGMSSYEWTADIGWNGFTVSVPMQSGEIKQVYFRRSSVSEVNRLVGSLTQSGNTAKYYANAQADLGDSQTRLSNDVNYYRPRILDEMRKAKAELARAQQRMKRVQQNLADKKAIAAQKHETADEAQQAAQTTEESVHASSLQADASGADADVSGAEADVTAAQVDLQVANQDLQRSRTDLKQIDARIAQLRQMIANDKRILHLP